MDPMAAVAIAGAAIKLLEQLGAAVVKIWRMVEERTEGDPTGAVRARAFDAAAREMLYRRAEAEARAAIGTQADIPPDLLADYLPSDMAGLVPMMREQMCLVMQPEKWGPRTDG